VSGVLNVFSGRSPDQIDVRVEMPISSDTHTSPPARDQNIIFALRDVPDAQICTAGRKSLKPSDLVIAAHPLRCGSPFALSIGARDRFTTWDAVSLREMRRA